MIKTFFVLLHGLIQLIQPVLVPLCFIFAWTIFVLMAWSMWALIRDSFSSAKRMHEIPCANCRFFTGDYHLKCPVHPVIALSEEAVDCLDYEPSKRY